ncbi:hypothetical protein HJFPF1_06086 [Paramyrothecium foliicola]|nr:hypothetical protein HJFPF1_06086 [Paramyrothecium foliicola]
MALGKPSNLHLGLTSSPTGDSYGQRTGELKIDFGVAALLALVLLPASPELQPQDLITAAKLHWSIEFLYVYNYPSRSKGNRWPNLCKCLVALCIADVFIVDFVTVSEALVIRPPYWIILL